MNKLIRIPALLSILLISFSSCKKNDDNSSSSASQVATLTTTVQQGSWKVTLYNDNGVDETNHYSGYTFVFNSNGTVAATKAGSTVTGTWSNGMDDSTLKLVLDFGTSNFFQEINDDWHVTQQSSTIIKLEDVSGGGSGTDYLTFEKI